ncbi:MAG: dTDP-4-dehydrorhamnose 3,5-epimerase [Turneriella sp.]|nr:dTDP-4-dehydrorhamnose 3,5-epimerase [Turneriella sp.]
MKFTGTSISGLFVVEQNVAKDHRGAFVKNFRQDEFQAAGLESNFQETYYTKSREDVIRGMHFQSPPHDHAKLITVIQGTIIDVVLDIRRSSGTYGQHFAIELSRENRKSLYIPRGLAHGFGVLSDSAIAYYQVTSVHNPQHDLGIRYSSFGYEWPIVEPILSERDKAFPALKDYHSPFA